MASASDSSSAFGTPPPEPRGRPSHGARLRRRRKRPKRSLTLSPSARDAAGDNRRDFLAWDEYQAAASLRPPASPLSSSTNRSFSPRAFHKKPDLPNFMRRGQLRKTHSEPTDIFTDEVDQDQVERIQEILGSLNFSKFHVAGSSPLSSLSNFHAHSHSDSRSEMTPTPSAKVKQWQMEGGINYPAAMYNHGHYPVRLSGDIMQTSFSGSEVMTTDIEELKEAAMSIEALSRRSRRSKKPPPSSSASAGTRMSVAAVTSAPSTLPRRHGITTGIGSHPRGVMQFLPSVRSSEFLSKTAYESYMASKGRRDAQNLSDSQSPPDSIDGHLDSGYVTHRVSGRLSGGEPLRIDTGPGREPLGRKISMPERFYSLVHRDEEERRKSSLGGNRLSRFASFGTMSQARLKAPLSRHHSTTDQPLSDPETASLHHHNHALKGVESLSGFNRFSRILRSLRVSRQNSPENMSPASSESALSSPGPPSDPILHHHSRRGDWHQSEPETSHSSRIHQADLLLWRKRSKGSLRRHQVTTHGLFSSFARTAKADHADGVSPSGTSLAEPESYPSATSSIKSSS